MSFAPHSSRTYASKLYTIVECLVDAVSVSDVQRNGQVVFVGRLLECWKIFGLSRGRYDILAVFQSDLNVAYITVRC